MKRDVESVAANTTPENVRLTRNTLALTVSITTKKKVEVDLKRTTVRMTENALRNLKLPSGETGKKQEKMPSGETGNTNQLKKQIMNIRQNKKLLKEANKDMAAIDKLNIVQQNLQHSKTAIFKNF
ncbi:hypothetical protein CEXT_209671 [Caerostris extrusa]|uniref:Uncharacterized protein n=1 Tax=Caerostris extrusa TaxID=172846 RepID=A0AAV4PJG4_CAEEX|nr:hypothetical protein CEXT_209671 [Caerostris extrusa]